MVEAAALMRQEENNAVSLKPWLPASVRDHLPAHAQDIYSQGLHLGAHLPAIESFLFAVVSAVDLTTGLLPMVLALTLVEGARRLAARKGILVDSRSRRDEHPLRRQDGYTHVTLTASLIATG